MTKHLKLLTVTFVVISMLASCKKDDDPQPAIQYETEGSITGKITGTSGDNTYTFNDDFNYTQFSLLIDAYAEYTANSNGSFTFNLARADFANSGNAYIGFTLSSASATSPSGSAYADVNYNKVVDNKHIHFEMYTGSSATCTITGISFDSTTGKVTGKYTMTGTGYSTGKAATVTGEFNLTAKKSVN